MQTRVLLYWTSGSLFPTLEAAVSGTLAAYGVAARGLVGAAPFQEVAERFALGQLNGMAFCQRVMQLCGVADAPETFRNRIVERLTFNPAMAEIMAQVNSEIAQWLVVDLPQAWFAPVLAAALANSPDCAHWYSPERVIYLERSRLSRFTPDVFAFLAHQVETPPEQCLLLDANLRRTVHSINNGLPAAVIMNPTRLKLEFLLRKLIAEEYCVHPRPGSTERR